jgi:phosphate acyltransferase
MRRIAVDAMGGDRAPEPELDAIAQILADGAIKLTVVGDEPQIKAGLVRRGVVVTSPNLSIRHATQVVTMDDPPASPVRQKKDSSMRVCFDLVKAGEADAVVSAGNSGAMLACGLFVWKRLPGVARPGIVTQFPTLKGTCVLCDMGANVDVEAKVLAQFATLGALYSTVVVGKKRPRVGLLSNGEEAHKGTELTREAHAILSAHEGPFEYVGYVEGRDIFAGDVDVVATDGFTGNVVLKTSEGVASAMLQLLKQAFQSSPRAKLGALMARPALQSLRAQLDYEETGGAPLLGVDGLALVCHGRSGGRALANAIRGAARFAERELVEHVRREFARFQRDDAAETPETLKA